MAREVVKIYADDLIELPMDNKDHWIRLDELANVVGVSQEIRRLAKIYSFLLRGPKPGSALEF